MEFTSTDFSRKDFRKIRSGFTRFYYEEISEMPGFTWQTSYYYKRYRDGRYRFVAMDCEVHEVCCHEEYSSAKEFADDLNYMTHAGNPWYLDGDVLDLFPEDLRKYQEEISRYFSKATAALILDAVAKNDNELVQALLPDFDELRKDLGLK